MYSVSFAIIFTIRRCFFSQDFSVAALGWLRFAMPTLVAIAILGGLTVHIMTSSRMCFAGARNGHMPELLAHINVKCMSPLPSLIFLVSIASLRLLWLYSNITMLLLVSDVDIIDNADS